MSSNDTYHNYKKYSLEHLENWLHDVISCEDITPQDIYDTIVNAVDENIEYHKEYLTKNIEVLSLLKGHRSVDGPYDGWSNPYDGWDYDAAGAKIPRICDRDDLSPECRKDWNDFWGAEDEYYPHPDQPVYTEEELNAMCDKATSDEEKDKCREYNLREAEYYDKRAKLDAEYEKSKHYWDRGRNKSYDQMIAEGWTMTDDGFWIKE